MGQPLSMDLRSRVLAAIDDGMSCRSAAARFGVAPSTAIRWYGQRRDTGSFTPKPQGGDMRSHRVEARRDDILAIWEARKNIVQAEKRLRVHRRAPGSDVITESQPYSTSEGFCGCPAHLLRIITRYPESLEK